MSAGMNSAKEERISLTSGNDKAGKDRGNKEGVDRVCDGGGGRERAPVRRESLPIYRHIYL